MVEGDATFLRCHKSSPSANFTGGIMHYLDNTQECIHCSARFEPEDDTAACIGGCPDCEYEKFEAQVNNMLMEVERV